MMLQRVAHAGGKGLGRDDERPSRFHSRRGRLLPVGELVRAPAMLVGRFRRKPADPQPWMARGAIARLEELLGPKTSLLELGSGSSTLWFAQRTGAITSLEDHDDWADRVADMTRGAANVELRRVTSLPEALAALDGHYDVGVVDHRDSAEWTRIDSLRALKDLCSILLLDDSDRQQYGSAETVLAGWRVERIESRGVV